MRAGISVTGAGAVSAAGLTLDECVRTLSSGRTALSVRPSSIHTSLQVPVGEVPATDGELKSVLGLSMEKIVSRTALLAAVAAESAVRDAGLDREALSSVRTGLVIGTSVGGMDLTEEFYLDFCKDRESGDIDLVRTHDCGAVTSFVAGRLGIKGFATTVSTACSSAGNAIMLGARMIETGLLDTVVAGGADSLTRFTMNGFNSLRILSESFCRPFDLHRDGLNIGEGAGFIVLSRDGLSPYGTVRPYCRLAGWACTDEAFHQTGSSESGDGAYVSMSKAIASAGLVPGDIDYVNTHGTATPGNDLSEGNAMRRLFGSGVPFGSFKGYIGHTLAASEGIEAALCAVALRDSTVWPSAGFSSEDPSVGLSPFMGSGHFRYRHLLSNSFGFGGNDSSLLFSSTGSDL